MPLVKHHESAVTASVLSPAERETTPALSTRAALQDRGICVFTSHISTVNMNTTNQGLSNDALRDTLARVQELSARVESSKHQQIRVAHWVRKLLAQPTTNATWTKNVLEYANALLRMLLHGVRFCFAVCLNARWYSWWSCWVDSKCVNAAVCVLNVGAGRAVYQDASTGSITHASPSHGSFHLLVYNLLTLRETPHMVGVMIFVVGRAHEVQAQCEEFRRRSTAPEWPPAGPPPYQERQPD